MTVREPGHIKAILGPTNTGKTHLAIERLCAHSSGMMGFPLRLLAREVYDRVVAIKGPKEVGLITGEEKIMPPGARWLLCTAESMPIDRDVAFVALDEAQLGADPERGHVFTDRLLNVRGREETMILGSESLKPIVRDLLPEAEIITRPRFSQLSFAGAKKLSRLPPRTAIIAFSAEDVYTIAEMIRRTKGGAAIVMGNLSPRTRNAQVAMYQSGEVDYLVATDAIGMGLNMDISHIAFASLSKFDGRRQRRLFLHEMAQIAGRAGRHQRDGTFGLVLDGLNGPAMTEVEIDRIEEHRFAPLEQLYWRNADLDYSAPGNLIDSLECLPRDARLKAAPQALDHQVLARLAGDPEVAPFAKGEAATRRLWDACGLPDFRSTGAEFHARLVARLYGYLVRGTLPKQLIADEIARLDRVQGDIATLASRIAACRTWTYIANRADWLADPAHWAERTQSIETRLSDALHESLRQRFVDRRSSRLLRSIGHDPKAARLEVDESGEVSVLDEAVGRLHGFRFTADPGARTGEQRKFLAAAEARLPAELTRRARELITSEHRAFSMAMELDQPVAIRWNGSAVATLTKGRSLIEPGLALDPAAARQEAPIRDAVRARLAAWLTKEIAQKLGPLVKIAEAGFSPDSPPQLRAFLAPLAEEAGVSARHELAEALQVLDPEARKRIRTLGLTIGSLAVFHPAMLKPHAITMRLALLSVRRGTPMPPVPMIGLGLLDKPSAPLAAAAGDAGFARFGDQMIRIDLIERLALKLHEQRRGNAPFVPDAALATSLGIGTGTLQRLLRALGYVPVEQAEPNHWRWRGVRRGGPVARPSGHQAKRKSA